MNPCDSHEFCARSAEEIDTLRDPAEERPRPTPGKARRGNLLSRARSRARVCACPEPFEPSDAPEAAAAKNPPALPCELATELKASSSFVGIPVADDHDTAAACPWVGGKARRGPPTPRSRGRVPVEGWRHPTRLIEEPTGRAKARQPKRTHGQNGGKTQAKNHRAAARPRNLQDFLQEIFLKTQDS